MSGLTSAELALVEQHVPKVRKLAKFVSRNQPPSITADDLESAGLFGLFKAAPHFDPARGCQAGTYLEHRILGAMLDCIRETTGRKGHPLPRLGNLDTYRRHLVSPDLSPEEQFDLLETRRTLEAAISRLPVRERIVVTLAFFGDLQNTEIAAYCGVSQGRISQHKTSALAKLRLMLASSPSAGVPLQRSLAA